MFQKFFLKIAKCVNILFFILVLFLIVNSYLKYADLEMLLKSLAVWIVFVLISKFLWKILKY